jgi:hypothetical protein
MEAQTAVSSYMFQCGVVNINYYLITPRVDVGKITKIFYGNMQVLLFEDEEYK